MPLKEADKVRNQILALLDASHVEQYIAAIPKTSDRQLDDVIATAVRGYAAHLRRQIGQGPTDSSFAIS